MGVEVVVLLDVFPCDPLIINLEKTMAFQVLVFGSPLGQHQSMIFKLEWEISPHQQTFILACVHLLQWFRSTHEVSLLKCYVLVFVEREFQGLGLQDHPNCNHNGIHLIVIIFNQQSNSMQNDTFISCLAWIHRGYAACVPLEYQMNEEEVEEIKENPMIAEHLQKEKMEDQMEDQEDDLPIFGQSMNENHNDKYPSAFDDLEDEEKQDYYIKDTDALIVAGKIEKQHSSLDVYIYQQDKSNLYIHHEIMLSAFPLSIAWLNVNLGSLNSNDHLKGNLAIVSSFLPQIQIWNLDLTQAIEPDLILGGEIVMNKKKPKMFSNKGKRYKEGSHTDSVLSLSLNHVNKGVLASGSADKSLKIWDLAKGNNIFTSNHGSGRVNKVQWSKLDPSVIFTTSQDGNITILDSRYPNDLLSHKIGSKQTISSASWNVNEQSQIVYATQQGGLYSIDARVPNKILFGQKNAHKGHEITDIKIGKKNLCFSCSEEGQVKVWSLNDLTNPLAVKNPQCGKLFCMDLMEEEEGPIITCGNSNGELFVWDVTENQNVNAYWQS